MLRNITIGQYYPKESLLHRLDPRMKLVSTFLYIISLFAFNTVYSYVVVLAFLSAIILCSRVPFRYMIRGLKPILILILVTVFLDCVVIPGQVIVQVWKITVTEEGIQKGVQVAVRLICLMLGTSLMTLTTTPMRLTDGIESLLKPLSRFHVPVAEIAMMMTIALRFIPILVEELNKLMKAQTSRGMDFHRGKLTERVRHMAALFIPLFVSAVRRANELATAMEARGYRGGVGRTKMKELKLTKLDVLAAFVMVIYFGSLVVVSIFLC